jgi:hypothetical protein
MADYSPVPVDYQPDVDDYSLVPVAYNPFADEDGTQQAPTQVAQTSSQPPPTQPQAQPAQIQTQPAQPEPQTQPQQTAAGAGQPSVNGPATSNVPGASSSDAGIGNAGLDPSNPIWLPDATDMSHQAGCGENPGHCGVGQAIGAVGDGAYSSLEGVGNALRFVGRSTGLYGPDEIHRSDQEIRAATEAIKDGGKLLIDSPEARSVAARVAKEAAAAYWADERHRYFLLGRLGFGALTGVGPVAAIGDSTRALETGHDVVDSLAKGVVGNP